ncbi:16S rRNA processing protein RimM [Egibacter rhizosphaerae]|uniref:Ribosome maturation factor RimM n=1 Tax=Egibacter rhizosphaerae TaxID=1670831 RepID=A0A411YCN7_9ACTN|nr:ribosome maturation factor RimM [Egibacter rhizosphaerae]QBI18969.1 16S rRNA processing protein RimM [Egibacter rhizosphaerae]
MSGHAIVGTVGKPFGLHGEVYVLPDPDIGPTFRPGLACRLPDGASLVVADSRAHGRRTIVAFEGVTDREAAEALRGATLAVARDDIPLAEDAHWVDDVLGREVVDAAGETIGVLEGVRDGAAHDLLVIARHDGGEVLVPAVDELVDLAADPVIVQPVPGLLDPDAPERE